MNINYKHLYCLKILMILGITTLFAQPPDTLWTKAIGGPGYNVGRSVQQTSDGGYIIAGETDAYGAGWDDVFLVKTDANGDTIWTKAFGGFDDDDGRSVQQTFDNGYIITGKTSSFGAGWSDVYLIKTDTNGDTIWVKTYGGPRTDVGSCVQQTADSGYIVVGWTFSFSGFPQFPDVYLIRTNENGDTIWTKTYGDDYGSDWGYSVLETADKGFIISGNTSSSGTSGFDAYLIKTDENGDRIWSYTYGGLSDDVAFSVQRTSDNGFIIVGQTYSFGNGGSDVYLIKTDSLGDTLWTKTYGGKGNDVGSAVQQTMDQGYIIVGITNSFGAGSFDFYVIRTNENGDTVWTNTYGGVYEDEGYSIQLTSDNGYIICGLTQSFGPGWCNVYLIKTESELSIEENQPTNHNQFFTELDIFPNPFSDKTTIKFKIPACVGSRQQPVPSVKIYDAIGQLINDYSITQLSNQSFCQIVWKGEDNSGNKLPTGVYIIKYDVGEYKVTDKVIIVR